MDFTWAVKQMNKGKEVRRSEWRNEEYRIFKTRYIIEAKTDSSNDTEKAFFSISDFEDDDWELFEEPEETLSDKIGNAICFGSMAKVCTVEDIKEFILRIKGIGFFNAVADDTRHDILVDIDKLAGERFK